MSDVRCYTLRDTVFEKNYRLQDIQLSKNRLAIDARRHACAEKNYRLQDIQLSKTVTCLAAASVASCDEVVVENTGLEPVTSWLQTRRSPS